MQNVVGTLRSRRSLVAAGAVGVAGVIGGMTVGAGMFASAATTAPVYSSELSQCANPSAPVPGTPVFTTRFTVGSGKVSGTIPVIPAATLTADNITPTLVNVVVTTQYNSGRSGGNKTDVVTVNLPGHQYNNPLLFNIPPVPVSEVVGTGTVAYSAQTTGKAFATVNVQEFIVQATSTIPSTVVGTVCPTGTTKVGSVSGQGTPAPVAPTAVTATPGGTTNAAGDLAPNNGAVTVKFTPTLQTNGSDVEGYEVLPIDLTSPTTVQDAYDVPSVTTGQASTTDTAQKTASISGLNTGHSYEFQVFAVTNLGVSGAPSAATAAVTPTVETVVTDPTPAQTAQIATKSAK